MLSTDIRTTPLFVQNKGPYQWAYGVTYGAKIILVGVQLVSDVISSPELSLVEGRLPVVSGPGFGFETDSDAPARAAEVHQSSLSASDGRV